MTTIFLKLANMSIIASWLIIIIVVILRMVLRKAPKWIFCLLWGIVAIRLVLPVSFQSTFSLVSNPEPLSPITIQLSQATIEHSREFVSNPKFSISAFVTILSIIWIIGLTTLLCYAIISHWRIKNRMQEAVLVNENIWICDNVKSPFILGIIKPNIYLSSNMDEREAAYVIAHEQAHLKRKDHIWKAFGFFLLSIYWFNPSIWIAYNLFCQDIELACDEKVVKDLNLSERKKYSEALLFCSLQKRSIMTYPLAFGEVGVNERIKNVLNYKKPTFWIGSFAVIICIIVGACFLTDSKNDNAERPQNVLNEQSHSKNQNSWSDDTENGLPGLEELEPVVNDNWPVSISRTMNKTTAKNLSFNIQVDKPMTLLLSFATESGKINMEIKNENGNKLFDETDIQTETFDVNIQESGTYTVIIQANNYTGSFEITPKE